MQKGKTVVLSRKSDGEAKEMPFVSRPLPSFTLTEKEFPAIKGWKVGKKYMLEIEVENVGMNKDEYMPKMPMTSRLSITKITECDMDEDEMKAKKGYV
jgi:hypothetical protein